MAAKYRLMFVSIVIIVTGISLLLTFLITPKYRAEVRLLPPEATSSSGGLAALAGQFSGIASMAGLDIDNSDGSRLAYSTIQSRAFLESFILDSGLLPRLFPDEWDSDQKEWRDANGVESPTIREGYKKFVDEIFAVKEDKQSGLVTVTVRWTNAVEAADWANSIANRLNRVMREMAMAESAKSIEFLNRELATTSVVEVRQAIHQLVAVEIKKAMLANVRHEFAYRVVDPAVVLDSDMYYWPRKGVIVLLGFLLGIVLASLAAAFRVISVFSKDVTKSG